MGEDGNDQRLGDQIQTSTAHKQLRPILDPVAGFLSIGVLATVVAFDLLPLLLFSIWDLVETIKSPDSSNSGRASAAERPPSIVPQLWMAWIPVVTYAAWAIASFPLSLARHRFKRGFMLFSGFIVSAATFGRLARSLGDERYSDGGTDSIMVVIACTIGLILLRTIAGWLHLVPRDWRS